MGEHRVLAGFLRFVFEFVDETAIFVDSEFMWKVTSRIFKNHWKPSLPPELLSLCIMAQYSNY